jgi:alkylation response protein AidB-like acyl-CoA dehydrogenase
MILTEDQLMIRETARRFAQEQLAPFAAERDRRHEFPKQAVRELGRLGLMGMTVPAQWDGAGADFVSYALAMEEIAAGEAATSTIMAVQNSLGCGALMKFATPAQKQRFLMPMARGEEIVCFCLTEPQAGSDVAALRTRAKPDGNGWAISGTKQFISSGANAQTAIIFAVTNPEAGKKGLSAFVVPTSTPGFRVARLEEKLGQNASDTAQLVFEDLRVTPEELLGGEGEGMTVALGTLEAGRVGIAAQSVGVARAALEAAVGYAKERQTFGKAIAEHQAVAFRLADMATSVEAARQLALYAASLIDAGRPCRQEASMAKLFASEIAEKVCTEAIQVHGGYGYVKDFPVERFWRDMRVCRIYEGTSDIQRLVISRELLKG